MEWTEVDQIRLNWTELDRMDRIVLNSTKWTEMDQFTIKVDQIGPSEWTEVE